MKVIGAKQQGISTFNETFVVNDYKDNVNLQRFGLNPTAQTLPLGNLNGSQTTFLIPSGSNAISLRESHLEYVCNLTALFKKPGVQYLRNGNWWQRDWILAPGQLDDFDPLITPYIPGIQSGTGTYAIAAAPTVVLGAITTTTSGQGAYLGEPYPISGGAETAAGPFQETIAQFAGFKHPTYQIFRKIKYYLQKISSAYSAQDMKTWFMSEKEDDGAVVIDGRPYYMVSYTKVGSKTFTRKVYLGNTNLGATVGGVLQTLTINSTAPAIATYTSSPAKGAAFTLAKQFSVPGVFINGTSTTQTSYFNPLSTWGATGNLTGFACTKYQQFKLPFYYISDIFQQCDEGLFYLNAVDSSYLNLMLKFQPYNLAKVFGNDLLNANENGKVTDCGLLSALPPNWTAGITLGTKAPCAITFMRLQMYNKASDLLYSDLKGSEKLIKKLQASYVTPVTTNKFGAVSQLLANPYHNITDMMFLFSPQDQSSGDSIYVHGSSSTMNSHDVVNAILKGDKCINYAFPYNFNIILPRGNQLLFQPQGIQSIEMYNDLTKGALGILNNHYAAGCCQADEENWKYNNAVIIINVESFKGDMMGDHIIADGISSEARGPILRYDYIANYDPQSDTNDGNSAPSQIKDDTVMDAQSFGQDDIGIDYFPFYELYNIIEPSKNKMTLDEYVEKYQ